MTCGELSVSRVQRHLELTALAPVGGQRGKAEPSEVPQAPGPRPSAPLAAGVPGPRSNWVTGRVLRLFPRQSPGCQLCPAFTHSCPGHMLSTPTPLSDQRGCVPAAGLSLAMGGPGECMLAAAWRKKRDKTTTTSCDLAPLSLSFQAGFRPTT